MRVFLSAAPSARALALPDLVAGFEADLDPDDPAPILALLTPPAGYGDAEPTGPPATREPVWLTPRPTGQTYRGLPLWEAGRA